MEKRIQLHTIFKNILGSNNVYFQPPESLKLQYPCIIYERSNIYTNFADNVPYAKKTRYSVMLIDRNPDSIFIDKLTSLESCIFDRHYTSDNLNHDTFNIYF